MIGEYLKTQRGSLTQKEFAEKIGISRTYLTDLENNRKSPSVKTLLMIADKLNKKLEINFVEYDKPVVENKVLKYIKEQIRKDLII